MSRPRRIPGTPRRPLGSTLFLLPSIPDDLDERTKNALAIRNACATEGRCPVCGTVGAIEADDELPDVWHITFRHDDDCPVLPDDEVTA